MNVQNIRRKLALEEDGGGVPSDWDPMDYIPVNLDYGAEGFEKR